MNPLRYRYQTYVFGEHDIHLRALRDTSQFHDPQLKAKAQGISQAAWSLFGVVWTASEILSQLMLDEDIAGKRILEVGCGLALASLVLNERGADITAMDIHPEAKRFLIENESLNCGRHIPFVETSWETSHGLLSEYDLIIGSDILYEPRFTKHLPAFMDRHGKAHCDVIVVDGDRGQSESFTSGMDSFGFMHSAERTGLRDHLDVVYGGWVHRYSR